MNETPRHIAAWIFSLAAARKRRSRHHAAAGFLVLSLLAACQSGKPVAMGGAISLDEDTSFTGQLVAFEVGVSALTYAVVEQPAHGTVTLDAATGTFGYQPAKNFNGPDQFTFIASDSRSPSDAATVSVMVNPVNDPPELPVILDQSNSAETLESLIPLPRRDLDGDLVEYVVSVAVPSVADAFVDQSATLVVVPKVRGSTQITVVASDGPFQVSTSFQFTVTDVTKLRVFGVPVPREQAITITNTSGHDVAFDLTNNGHLLATTGDQLVQEVQSLPDEIPGEPFERKLWRYVRDGSYWFDPLTASYWQHDPLLFLNSVGFGYCDDLTAVFATMAKKAGYAARGWDLRGHVVPEVWIDGRWAMYDPDLAVYYQDTDGHVANVGELSDDPSPIVSPIAPVSSWSWPYSQEVADIYATTANNVLVQPDAFVDAHDAERLRLTPQATITYPGRWTPSPTTIYGTTSSAMPQLRLQLPAGFNGTVDWPLVPWDVQGEGLVRVGDVTYDAGSSELTAALQSVVSLPLGASLPRSIEVVEATGSLAVIYLLNPLRFSLQAKTSVTVRSLDAWALDVQLAAVPEDDWVGYNDTSALVRPR
jgi:hypothetical protein